MRKEMTTDTPKIIAPSFLSDEFLSKYPESPAHMTPLGAFTYYRTYSRFLPKLKRRETWKETCARTVQYSFSIEYIHRVKMSLKIDLISIVKEAEEFFDNMFNLRQFTSGRTMWTGGSEVADEYPMSNFNCSFTNIEKWEDLSELFYLLMLGSGVGFKSTPEMAKGMAPIRTNVNLILSEYKPVKVEERLENTEVVIMENGYAKIYVGDSKEGWRDSLAEYINLLTKEENEHVHTIKVSFNSVRPQGERLKKFGGTASGPQPLHDMFQGIDNALKNKIDDTLAPIEVNEKGYGHVRPIHILDMCNLIANNVIAGGVRRSSEIMLFDPSDYEVLFAKYALYGLWGDNQFETHEEIRQDLIRLGIPVPGWFDRLAVKNYDKEKYGDLPFNTYRTEAIKHRAQSNNSIQFMERPYKGFINLIFKMIKFGGDPGFVNMEEMLRRRDNAQGTNPCGEIILDSKQQCNLTTVNLTAFSTGENFDLGAAKRAQALSARAGLRMTLLDLELPEWDRIHKRDRLIGCSMAGIQDALGWMDRKNRSIALKELHDAANEAAGKYADELRIPHPLLTTAEKPDGSLALVAGGVSPGVHHSHAPYYIRRIRVSISDALAEVALIHGWPVNYEDSGLVVPKEKATKAVIDFPIKTTAKRTKADVGALEQLEDYFMFQKEYVEHNTSNTIHVRDHEWGPLEDEIYKRWDDFVGVTFLSLYDNAYPLMPYEEITKEQYEEMSSKFMPFDHKILEFFETTGASDLDENDPDCATGGCPTR